jgi:hypothetical protein
VIERAAERQRSPESRPDGARQSNPEGNATPGERPDVAAQLGSDHGHQLQRRVEDLLLEGRIASKCETKHRDERQEQREDREACTGSDLVSIYRESTLNRAAIITDIHANLAALQASLEAIGVDSACCGGDLVGYGPHPNEVCALIEQREIPRSRDPDDLRRLRRLRRRARPRPPAAAART